MTATGAARPGRHPGIVRTKGAISLGWCLQNRQQLSKKTWRIMGEIGTDTFADRRDCRARSVSRRRSRPYLKDASRLRGGQQFVEIRAGDPELLGNAFFVAVVPAQGFACNIDLNPPDVLAQAAK
jgi:hypothetical protein